MLITVLIVLWSNYTEENNLVDTTYQVFPNNVSFIAPSQNNLEGKLSTHSLARLYASFSYEYFSIYIYFQGCKQQQACTNNVIQNTKIDWPATQCNEVAGTSLSVCRFCCLDGGCNKNIPGLYKWRYMRAIPRAILCIWERFPGTQGLEKFSFRNKLSYLVQLSTIMTSRKAHIGIAQLKTCTILGSN